MNNKFLIHFGKKKIKIVSFVLVVILSVFCIESASFSKAATTPSYLTGITSDSIKQKEEEIAKAKEEKAQIASLKSDVESIKNSLEQQKNDLSAYITELDNALEQMQYNIEDLNDQILLKEADIAQMEETLEEAKEAEETRYQDMIIRMRKMYEQNDSSILSSLLGATSLTDFLNRMDYIEAIVSYDRAEWEALKAYRQYIELCEEELEIEYEALADSLAAVEEEEANMELLIEEKNTQLNEYMASIAASQSQIDEYTDMIDDADDEIALLEQAILVEKQQIYEAQNKQNLYDGGAFVYPLSIKGIISSKYGYRIHPVYGTQKFHSGVDIAVAKGTPIYAAYSGTVANAGYNSSMGNFVMINHGGGLYTIYMHASSLAVSTGDVVTTGQTIAYVGSTGVSTGNHLHFSVRLNGNYVDPNDYVYFYAR